MSLAVPFSSLLLTFYSKQFQKILTKQGLKFKLHTKVTSAEKVDGKVLIKTESAKDGKEDTVRYYTNPRNSRLIQC